MSEKIPSEMMSRRRAFSLLAAAVGLAVPTTVLNVSNAEAETSGMTRRQDRRTGRSMDARRAPPVATPFAGRDWWGEP